MSVFSIRFEARDPAHNRLRPYQLDGARDLFGTWLVEVKFDGSASRAADWCTPAMTSMQPDTQSSRQAETSRLRRNPAARLRSSGAAPKPT
jgi:hypothetical protein